MMEWWEYFMVAGAYIAVNQSFEWFKRWRQARNDKYNAEEHVRGTAPKELF